MEPALLITTVGALLAGAAAWLAGNSAVADVCWAAGTLVAVVPGDLLVVAPGEVVPVVGLVEGATAALDESV